MKRTIKDNLELILIIIIGVLLGCSFIFSGEKMIFISLAYIIINFDLFFEVGINITKGKLFDENFIMLMVEIGTLIMGHYLEGLIVMLLYYGGMLLNKRLIGMRRTEIIKSIDIRNNMTLVINNNKRIITDSKRVKIGDIIMVKPGEIIPLDGKVIEGEAMVDISMITSEKKTIKIKETDEVLSGWINLNGVLKIEVTKLFKDTTISKILKLLEKTDGKKSKIEIAMEKFIKIYTPIVILLAFGIFIIPALLTNDYLTWGYRSLVILIIASPWSLIKTIPLAHFSGMGACCQKGIIIKNSVIFNNLLAIDEIIFDKTGTITEGDFEVVKVKGNGISARELLQIAAHCECNNPHLVAQSIIRRYGKEIDETRVKNYKMVDGGITVTLDGDKYIIGNYNLLHKNKIKLTKAKDIGTIVYIGRNGEYLGYILVSDKIRKTSKKIVSDLKKRNIRDLVILSGDNEDVVAMVCKKVGIERYMADLLSQDKVKYLKEAKKEHVKVMFVGDSIDDSASLAISDIGVSMGGNMSDAAIENSDVIIMDNNLSRINKAMEISELTMGVIKRNMGLILSIKLIVLLLAIFGYSSILSAILIEIGVTLLSILNTFKIIN